MFATLCGVPACESPAPVVHCVEISW